MATWKRLAAVAACLALSGVPHASAQWEDQQQGISAGWTVLTSFNMPFMNVKIDFDGLTWDCSGTSCALGNDARLNVLITPDDDQPIAYQQATTRFWAALSVGLVDDSLLTFPEPKGIQDPRGGVWTVAPDLTSWRFGVHVRENLAPQDAQGIVSDGSLTLRVDGIGSSPLTRPIGSESGWVELDPGLAPGEPYATYESPWDASWILRAGGGVPFVVAPVYALPSLNPSCMSADCMRYERGTLMVDALRMSFAVQGVSAPVPEPSVWLSVTVGLAVVGAVARRRRAH